jgi:L-ribulokinase
LNGKQEKPLALGLDFGTESVRALLATLEGETAATAVAKYAHGQIVETLPGGSQQLPADYALQDPADWIDAAILAVRQALHEASQSFSDPSQAVIGIGVDFTSCTMLPALADGTPLCKLDAFAKEPLAWPKLWKHHGAQSQTERINRIARERREPFLARYGGTIGLEWFFPKILETLEGRPEVYDACEVWLEAGDWFVWKLVGAPASELPRSTCQAGYKGMWSKADGFPSADFFAALNPKLSSVVQDKLPGRFVAPGSLAGRLCLEMANRLGLPEGLPVSAAIIDAHAGVPGAGAAEPGTLVLVMGTSGCHMLNSEHEVLVPGVAGIVADGIFPGYIGYETGQAAVGDAFDWLRRVVGEADFERLDEEAAKLPAGADGVFALDWQNGCRTPLMDGSLSGAFLGLSLRHSSAHLYRALLEASAFGLCWIVDLLRQGGVPVCEFVATGGLPHHNRLYVQICADALGKPISIHPSSQGPALGAAILGALAAGPDASGFENASAAIRAMAAPNPTVADREPIVVSPNEANTITYARLYDRYRRLAETVRVAFP